MDFDAGGGKPFRSTIQCGRAARARVATDHLHLAGTQDEGSGYAGACQAKYQVWPTGQWRAVTKEAGHDHDAF
jgi:hypothetical protein